MKISKRVRRHPVNASKQKGDQRLSFTARIPMEGHRQFRHNYQQPAPLLFTADQHPLWLGDIYRGASAFLIAGGPSFTEIGSSQLNQPGVLTMGVNNSPKTFRPNLWVSVDEPDHFLRSIWLDPTITKFTPIVHARGEIFDSDTWKYTNLTVADCPNVVYYKRNHVFKPEQYLWEDCFNWGNNKEGDKNRSVMLVALRILFVLGIRRVYLLGVDFNMSRSSKYHFEQGRSNKSISWNNKTYERLNKRFAQLRPYFEEEDFHVFNCNPESRLTAFDHLPFEEALRRVKTEFGNIDVTKERTLGLYDTNSKQKRRGTSKSLVAAKKKATRKRKVAKKKTTARKKVARKDRDGQSWDE